MRHGWCEKGFTHQLDGPGHTLLVTHLAHSSCSSCSSWLEIEPRRARRTRRGGWASAGARFLSRTRSLRIPIPLLPVKKGYQRQRCEKGFTHQLDQLVGARRDSRTSLSSPPHAGRGLVELGAVFSAAVPFVQRCAFDGLDQAVNPAGFDPCQPGTRIFSGMIPLPLRLDA